MEPVETERPVTKNSLVLAGGGMRVAYQAGVLLALGEAGLRFDHVDGTSGGIFNTAMLASGVPPMQIAHNWRTLDLSGFVSFTRFKNYLNPFKINGFADADGIKNKVFPHLGIDILKINQCGEFNATFNVCNFSDKSIEAISGKSVKLEHLLAGVSLPIFMPALQIDGTWYTDAVWIKDANLIEAVRQGSSDIWLVWAIGNAPTFLGGSFSQYVHMIEMSANGGLLEEYKQIELTKNIRKLEGVNQPIRVFVIKSRIPLPLDPDFFFNKVNARELVNMGYAHTKDYLKNIPPDGEVLDEKLTKNLEPNFIYSFRSEFSGIVKLGDKPARLGYSLFFRFCEFEDRRELEIYSSLSDKATGEERSAYDHSFTKTKAGDKVRFHVEARVLWKGQTVQIEADTVLGTPIEILLGLNFKRLNFKLKQKNHKLIGEGLLTQSIFSRIKSLMYSQVKTTLPTGIGMKKRLQLIKHFIAHEI